MPVAPTRESSERALRRRFGVTVDGCSAEDDTSDAAPAATSLDDPGGEKSRVLASRSPAQPGDFASLADLAAILAAGA